MLKLLRHPTPELPCTLEESELCICLGNDGVAVAPHTRVDMRAWGAVCTLGDDGAAAVTHTGADTCARGAVYALGDDRAAMVPHTGAFTPQHRTRGRKEKEEYEEVMSGHGI